MSTDDDKSTTVRVSGLDPDHIEYLRPHAEHAGVLATSDAAVCRWAIVQQRRRLEAESAPVAPAAVAAVAGA
jgi:hypothetical protein